GRNGELRLSGGVGEGGVAVSPDTIVLPAAVRAAPTDVVQAAMRVLGQAWSIAKAPAGTLPSGVRRITQQGVVQKALSVAEAGLRIDLGQPSSDALRDLLFDFYGGENVDPGFDQLLRETDAGR